MSRVPLLATHTRSVQLLTTLNAAVARAQEQIATGREILTPADDPSGAARVLLLEQSINSLTQFSRNADIAETRLQREEAAVTSVNDLLQRARELVVQGSNASQSNESRGFIAVELREIREQLLQTANTSDGNGRFIFSGFQVSSKPFSEIGGQVQYNGDQGVRRIQIGAERSIADSDPGSEIFFGVQRANGVFSVTPTASNGGSGVVAELELSGNQNYDFATYEISLVAGGQYEIRDSANTLVQTGAFSAGETIEFGDLRITLEGEPDVGDTFTLSPAGKQSMFDTLDQIATVLERGANDGAGRAQLYSSLNRGLEDLDQSILRVSETRTRIGSRLSTIENQRDLNEGYRLVSQQTLADVRDLDYTAAISELTQQLTALEAAQKTFARIQGLSLFNAL